MSNNSSAALCLTPSCIHAASNYLTNLSPDYKTIDPCTNFEEFVCGGWRENHDMRADQGLTDALGLINDDVTSTIRHILEGSYPNTSAHSSFSPQNLLVAASSVDRQNFDEIQVAYNACMDVEAITKRGMAPIVERIDELAATFGNSSSSRDYTAPFLYLNKLGISAFFSFGVEDDEKNPETEIVGVRPIISVGLPSKEYYEDKEVVAQYQDAMTKVLGAIQPTVAKIIGTAADVAASLVRFETKLSAVAPEKADMFDVTKTYNLVSVKDVVKLVPQFGLETVLEHLVPSNYTLNITVTAFPEILANVSHIVAETPEDTVRNFFYWRLIVHYSGAVLGPEIKPWRQFQNTLQGKEPDADPERWRTCVSHVGGSLGWILSRFFIEKAFSAAAKDFGNQIISDIKAAYLKKFASLAWMDDEVKKVAAEKVHNIDQKVGYPSASPNILDPDALRSYYNTVNISNSYFDNILSVEEFETKREWSALGKPTNMQEWGMIASTVNAYYNPTHNEIVFPAGIMQFPLFSVDLPSYVSYGAFGAVAGHELSHAFDNNGRHYDLHGRYDNWWTNSTIAAFTDKAQCIEDEFSNFTVIGKDGPIHIKGRQTLGENIADSGGLSAAWLAWNDRRTGTTTAATATATASELSLPGLDYFTHEQLFFLSYGNAWCSKFRPAMLTNRVTTDEHSPDPVRIRGTVQNSRGFLEAFNCPVKEPTCELW
ncbi:endothelin-converting enzyme [Niveomyces insectorum RCEF 264]|uniref:Endothelin-converting enzyme n=1 Tax=Niveomyces insectorum RCEF 264 TaxID=1081102 RepID=A0A167XNP3_9HYPO|nr:endothelin-converting enzyme [Niveomyces insectorum RCEF 264]